MGLFSWLKRRATSHEEENPFPSDRVIAGKLATLIDFHLHDPQTTGGLAQLLKPTCVVVLEKDGNVSLKWPSSPDFAREAISFVLLSELPAFKDFVQQLTILSQVKGGEGVVNDWLQLMGPTMVDNIVVEAVQAMKSKCEARLKLADETH